VPVVQGAAPPVLQAALALATAAAFMVAA